MGIPLHSPLAKLSNGHSLPSGCFLNVVVITDPLPTFPLLILSVISADWVLPTFFSDIRTRMSYLLLITEFVDQSFFPQSGFIVWCK